MQFVITFAILRKIAVEDSCALSRIMMYILCISQEGNCLFSCGANPASCATERNILHLDRLWI